MKSLLIHLFIKNPDDTKDPAVRRAYGTLASLFGIVSNVIICVFKLVIGLLFGLISFVADGVNNLTDALSSLISLIGFKISAKPADKDHPFGHARMEYISGFIVSIFVAVLGFELITQSIEKIFAQEEVITDTNHFIISCVILSVAIIVKIYQCYFNYSIGKKINSTSLKATASDSRNDVISTTVILIGLIISYFSHVNLDGYLGTAVGIFILVSGIKLIVETINPLLGQKPEKETVQSLMNTIKAHKEVLGIHDLQIHSYGPSCVFATCHVEVDASQNILDTHDIIDNIEKECFDKLKIHTVLHMDPVVINDPYTDEVKKEMQEIISSFDMAISMHDFRVVKGPTHTNIVFDIVVPHDKKMDDDELVKAICEKAKAYSPKYNCVIEVDQDYSDFLSEVGEK